ncbi:hypothetical protein ONZ45_g10018 [Pleurotus djamor]|nr:hypothetical protein ONZ45_g10018 [Pleurotus djamor]
MDKNLRVKKAKHAKREKHKKALEDLETGTPSPHKLPRGLKSRSQRGRAIKGKSILSDGAFDDDETTDSDSEDTESEPEAQQTDFSFGLDPPETIPEAPEPQEDVPTPPTALANDRGPALFYDIFDGTPLGPPYGPYPPGVLETALSLPFNSHMEPLNINF